jgi:hypothetical protein
MGIQARREYLIEIRERYRNSSRKEKGKILDEFCKVCDYGRKHGIRILNGNRKVLGRKPGPKVRFDSAFIEVLETLWISMRRMCGKKMVQALPHWLPHNRSPKITPEIRAKLLKISASHIDRVLKPIRTRSNLKGLSSTKPGAFLKAKIPLRVHHWEIKTPGFMQADTVAHCGESLAGAFANSLTMTDIDSTWTENRAAWTKGSLNVYEQIKNIEEELPFPILGWSSDNGGEVMNEHLYKYFQTSRDEGSKVEMTRGRPYRKNDQAHVEQKNFSHVRQVFGYERFEHPDLVPLMNDIYKNYWGPLQNFFVPSQKLIRKERIGAKVKKQHDIPMTPYQRLMNSDKLTEKAKKDLKHQYERLDPFALSRELDKKLHFFFKEVKIKKLK